MQLTQRDLMILHFVNEFGFCEIRHIEKRFRLKKLWAYQIMQRLVKNNYLKHEKILYRKPGVFRLTDKGAELTHLPSLAQINVAQYHHTLTIIDVFLTLTQQYPGLHWTSERRIKYERYCNGITQKKGHTADAKVVLPDKRNIAIEVELTLKNKTRLHKILKSYSTEFSIAEVWYFCPQLIANVIHPLILDLPLIKVFNLPEFLHE